ncbi:ferrous iron transport protein B [Paenibacillus timonensis]|uniref:Ferrous iron transport protein B n=1 Tax=Paenibacillus timonensis TaxID=225915 RepID=A0ABW3SHJ3_9BACL|nr:MULTISPECIES: ferrous iron transport protein B [Paenibacillus]MCH1642698.1 ferrous iron transport protein B [Paenibacillus timonensis]MDU2242059.1 ferrous iron transport protein B [Paenibacillus sp.]
MNQAALIGNPNTGKTSLFNTLTSSYEYVGNWAGVTVEKKVGHLRNNAGQLTDLPGIYTLHPLSKDEGVAAEYLAAESPSVLVNIVDASNLERNLYLTLQLLEYGKPVIVGLNMIDVANANGLKVDPEKLTARLGSPVLPLIARTGKGSKELLRAIEQLPSEAADVPHFTITYGEAIERAIRDISRELAAGWEEGRPSLRWIALQVLEENPAVIAALPPQTNLNKLHRIRAEAEQRLAAAGSASSAEEHIRTVRIGRIREICSEAVDASQKKPHTMTERIDRIATHPVLGIPLFMAFMFLTFQLTFDWLGNPLSDLLDGFITGPLTGGAENLLTNLGASSFTHALIIDGIIGGVGGVLVFIPQIFIMFLIISFIEDSGYMARITVMMDKLMEIVGLNGKALIPFILGFGCNVPAVMASRSIEQPKERMLTMLLIPLMSCSARLPVYALFAGIFFAESQGLIVFSLYMLGIVLALVLAKVFSLFLFKNERSFFMVELPPYRMPQSVTLFRSTWEKGKGFLRKAGTFILGGSVLIWLLTYLGPGGVAENMDDSFLAAIGGLFSSVLQPLGFGTWQSGAALITGFMAKEVVVSTMNIIYHAPDMAGLQGQIAASFTGLQAYSFMAFVLLYTPCLATVGVLRKETASWKWTLFSIAYSLTLAYLVSLLIYQVGLRFGFGLA